MFSGGMACVFWETNCSSRKCMCSLEKWPFAPRNNQFPREIIPFLKEKAHFPWGATSSPGKCTYFPGSNKFPGEDECVPWEHVQFPPELVIRWETSAIPSGTCYSPRNKCIFLGELFFPWETRAIPCELVVPCEKLAFSLGNLLFLGKKKGNKKKKKEEFFFHKILTRAKHVLYEPS